MEENKLICCPFCGETDIHIDTYEGEEKDMYEIYTITCPECEITFMLPGEKEKVINLWNRRDGTFPVQTLIDNIKQ